MLSLYCYIRISFFAWQVIGTAAIKLKRPYRYALVLQTPYFDPKYLKID